MRVEETPHGREFEPRRSKARESASIRPARRSKKGVSASGPCCLSRKKRAKARTERYETELACGQISACASSRLGVFPVKKSSPPSPLRAQLVFRLMKKTSTTPTGLFNPRIA